MKSLVKLILMLFFVVFNLSASEVYIVQKGDTLYSIAKKNNISINEILDTNNLELDKIYLGQHIYLKKAVPRLKMAIVIDDVGAGWKTKDEFIKIKAPLTFAILPFEEFSYKSNLFFRENSYKTILHLPLEGSNERLNLKTKGMIFCDMTPEMIIKKFTAALKSVGKVDGFNNHMGSKFSTDVDKISCIMEEAMKSNLYFIDSGTTKYSISKEVALKRGLKAGRARFFIDNEKNVEYIGNRIKEAVSKIQFEKENLIVIGHYCPETAQAILENIDYIKNNNIELVFANEILE